MDALSLIRLQQTQNTRIDTVTNEVTLARPSVAGTPHQTLKQRLDAMETEINAAISGLEWKPAVDSFGDLATTYPNAQEGWTASVKDTNYVYRYDDRTQTWEPISANSIPLATGAVNGLMSSADKSKLDSINVGELITTAGGVITGGLEVQGGITGDLTGKADTAGTADKVANKLTISIDGAETEYDGSQAQRVEIASANHEHTADKITAMTGYDKGQAGTTPILVGDSLNTAIGKLENGLDGKADSVHTHVGSEVTLTGYTMGVGGAISDTDTVNEAIGKLEAGLNGKAESNHEHNYAGSDTPGGVATSAKKLEVERTIELVGNVTGSAKFDGSGDIQINTTLVGGGDITLTSTLEHKRIDQTGQTVTVTLTGYDSAKDILRVYSSGMLLRPTYHYTVNNAGDDYTFTATANANNEWIVGEEMTFEVIKASL